MSFAISRGDITAGRVAYNWFDHSVVSEVAADWRQHYAAIHRPRRQTDAPAVQHADIPSPQSATP